MKNKLIDFCFYQGKNSAHPDFWNGIIFQQREKKKTANLFVVMVNNQAKSWLEY